MEAYLHARSNRVVRDDVLGDISNGAEGVFHKIRREINVALHHARDLVDDSHSGFLDQRLRHGRRVHARGTPQPTEDGTDGMFGLGEIGSKRKTAGWVLCLCLALGFGWED